MNCNVDLVPVVSSTVYCGLLNQKPKVGIENNGMAGYESCIICVKYHEGARFGKSTNSEEEQMVCVCVLL